MCAARFFLYRQIGLLLVCTLLALSCLSLLHGAHTIAWHSMLQSTASKHSGPPSIEIKHILQDIARDLLQCPAGSLRAIGGARLAVSDAFARVEADCLAAASIAQVL